MSDFDSHSLPHYGRLTEDKKQQQKQRWWARVISLTSGSRSYSTSSGSSGSSSYEKTNHLHGYSNANEEDEEMDQDFYVRSILESYSSSVSSNNRFSGNRVLEMPQRLDEESTASIAGDEEEEEDEVNNHHDHKNRKQSSPKGIDEEAAIMESEEDRKRRRQQRKRRRTNSHMKAKLLEKDVQRARTRRKTLLFSICIGTCLSAFIVAAVLIANVRIHVLTHDVQDGSIVPNDENNSSNTTSGTLTPKKEQGPFTPAPSYVLNPDGTINFTKSSLPPAAARSGVNLITPEPITRPPPVNNNNTTAAMELNEKEMRSKKIWTYVHCLLVSTSLWMSMFVIGMYCTYHSFRAYSMPFVLELHCVQCGYWITALLLQWVNMVSLSKAACLLLCISECFFNFGQITFTCAIAFNMYRSVVSYADVLLDSTSAKKRYRSYTINVMLLSLLASVTLSLVGFRTDGNKPSRLACLYESCRAILYIYYPLLAFSFNFIFYVRFKRTIGNAYPVSATGRLNQVARSYLLVFVVCWGSLITLTAIKTDEDYIKPRLVISILQSIFDVLGVATAIITISNYCRCRRAFDFGLSLKAIDAGSIEFEEPLKILGEGTFAVVLKAKWHQGFLDENIPTTVDVAVKTFKHTQFETLEQMKEEAYLASKLVHPCVMMTYGCYTIGSNLYIVSEYLGGGTLQDIIDANIKLPYDTILRYAHMIAQGMRFLHGLPVPIIHRDLKPLNCIFDSDQEMLKLADFGESRLFRKERIPGSEKVDFYPSDDITITMTTNIGSACWAAPEVLREEDKGEYSLKVDVYSFGIICWQLLTCTVPYVEIPGSVLAVAEAVMGGLRPEIPSDCPTLFAKIMRRCWHEDALRRPNFEDIVQLLEMEMSEERKRKLKKTESSSEVTILQQEPLQPAKGN